MNEKANENIDIDITKTGKQFYSWGTIGTFSGATGVIVLIWNALKSIGPGYFNSNIVPLVISFLMMGAFAILTEPPEKTTLLDKSQKAVETIVNSFLLYSVVVGLPALIPAMG